MSALVADYLNASGLKAEIKQGMSATTKKAHAWVVCQNNIIEATQLRITKPTNPTYAEYATPVTYSARVMKEQYDWRNSKYIKGKIPGKARGGDDPVTNGRKQHYSSRTSSTRNHQRSWTTGQ